MKDSKEIDYTGINYCVLCGTALVIQDDREGKRRPQCPSCAWVYYKNPVPAVAIVLFNDKGELLLIKRRFEPKAGEWALPSGYMEIYLTPEENAMEELWEETGLKGEILHCIGWHYGSSPIYQRILNIGFRMKASDGILCAGDDAEEAVFCPLTKLPAIAFASHRYFIDQELAKL